MKMPDNISPEIAAYIRALQTENSKLRNNNSKLQDEKAELQNEVSDLKTKGNRSITQRYKAKKKEA